MTSITSNGFYNKTLHSLQNNDSQILSTLHDGIVKTKIMECINTNSHYINLTNAELDLISSDIFNLSMFRDHIYELDLSENRLISLPESIGNLSTLNYLCFFQNQLTTLPESIC